MFFRYFGYSFLFGLFVLIGCSGDHRKSDESLYYCLCEAANASGLDVPNMLAKNEQYMIGKGMLKDGSGQSYYDYCQSLVDSLPRDISFNLDFGPSFFTSMADYKEDFAKCCAKLKVRESRKMKQMDQVVLEYRNQGISIAAAQMIRILTPEDLDHDIYKLKMILTLVQAFESEFRLQRILPPLPAKTE